MLLPVEMLQLRRTDYERRARDLLSMAKVDDFAAKLPHELSGGMKLALLSVAEVKLAIVTDDDINIYDPDELDWAMTFRIQADHDVLIIPGARGKHIDPSVRAWSLGKGGLPTTAKLGIDATIPEGVPREQYERLRYFAKDAVRLEDYL